MTIESLPAMFRVEYRSKRNVPQGSIVSLYGLSLYGFEAWKFHPQNPVDLQLALRLIGAEPVAIDKADIQSREIHEPSLMPASLLSTLKDDEAIALIAYLRTTKQVPPKE